MGPARLATGSFRRVEDSAVSKAVMLQSKNSLQESLIDIARRGLANLSLWRVRILPRPSLKVINIKGKQAKELASRECSLHRIDRVKNLENPERQYKISLSIAQKGRTKKRYTHRYNWNMLIESILKA